MRRIGLIGIALAFLVTAAGPSAVRADLASYYDEPDTIFASNVVIDIIEHNGGIWFATGEGLNFTLDSGQTWLLYSSSNGLISENMSALSSVDSRLWVGSNHDVIVGGELFSISDGVSFTDDDGRNWSNVDFYALGFNNLFGKFVDQTVFDITGHYNANDPAGKSDWVFFSAFAAGLLGSRDGGITWRRLFPSSTDSANFYSGSALNLANRNFAAVVDTTHGDSLYLWTGTANGVYQYVYILPRDKEFAAQRVNGIAVSDVATGPDDDYLFYAGDLGVVRGLAGGGPKMSRFADSDPNGSLDGLPGSNVSAIFVHGGTVIVGTTDSAAGASTGLATSTDMGLQYVAQSSFTDVIGANRMISDFAVMGGRLYMAAEEAGLFVSVDTGLSWTHLWVDNSDTTADNRRNVVHALNAYHDTLRVGTDSGLVTVYMDVAGNFDSTYFNVFPEDDSSSTKVVGIKVEEFYHPIDSIYDSLCIWTINYPLTAQGEYCVHRSIGDDDRAFMDNRHQVGVKTYDVDFFGDSVFVATAAGVRFSTDGQNGVSNQRFTHQIIDHSKQPSMNMDSDEITVFDVRGDTVLVGSDNGFAVSYDRGVSYLITRVNRDSLGADVRLNYNAGLAGITGNFVPAVALQYIENEPARVWASMRPTIGGSEGISVGFVNAITDSLGDTVSYVREFAVAYEDGFAWNMAFNGDSVFAATDGGLIMNHAALGADWDTLEFASSTGRTIIEKNTPVYAVEVIDGDLWVGTDDGLVRMGLSGPDIVADEVYRFIDSTTAAEVVYAYPVPFSRSRAGAIGDEITFHFVVDRDASVTIEVYDFAMNLVRRVMDGRFLAAGNYHVPDFGNTWDGLNGTGEDVAVGIYHFKVEFSTGEVRWGKLAVIP